EATSPDEDVLDLLARLVDRSLVVAVDGTAGVRYRLLESVAEYCLARLAEAGETDRVRAAHARHYLALAEQAEPHLHRHEQKDADVALRLVNALAWYWFLRGRLAEARRSLETALTAAPGADRAAGSPVADRAAGWLAGFAALLGEEVDWEPVLARIEDPAAR